MTGIERNGPTPVNVTKAPPVDFAPGYMWYCHPGRGPAPVNGPNHRTQPAEGSRECMNSENNSGRDNQDVTGYSGGLNPVLKLERASDRRMILNALDTLSEEQRNVFVLHDVEGFSVPEIVKMTDAPLNTLYAQLKLAREKFVSAIRLQQTPRGE